MTSHRKMGSNFYFYGRTLSVHLVGSFRHLYIYVYICLNKQFSYRKGGITIWDIFLSNLFFSSSWKMPVGTLEVLLISAKGLENTDYLCKFPLPFNFGSIFQLFWCLWNILIVILIWSGNMDPYVVLTCRSQEQKSSIASGWFMLYNFGNFVLSVFTVVDCIQERDRTLNGTRLLYSVYLKVQKSSIWR